MRAKIENGIAAEPAAVASWPGVVGRSTLPS